LIPGRVPVVGLVIAVTATSSVTSGGLGLGLSVGIVCSVAITLASAVSLGCGGGALGRSTAISCLGSVVVLRSGLRGSLGVVVASRATSRATSRASRATTRATRVAVRTWTHRVIGGATIVTKVLGVVRRASRIRNSTAKVNVWTQDILSMASRVHPFLHASRFIPIAISYILGYLVPVVTGSLNTGTRIRAI